MAARSQKIRHDDETRLKIRTSQLVNRLTEHALGQIALEATQVKAIEILLRKTLPDLQSIDANIDGEIRNFVISGEPMSEDDWEATYGVATSDGAAESTH